MPRNKDGSFTKPYNWREESANNRTFTGAKLQADTEDLAQGIAESLDRQGRGAMQANLDMANNNIVNLKEPERLNDALSVEAALSLQAGITMVDDGSIKAEGLIKLKPIYNDMASIQVGMIVNFIAPFTIDVNIIKANKSYEKIEIFGVKYKVLRAAYMEDATYEKEGGIKDGRPTFIEGTSYKLQLIAKDSELVFTNANNMPKGSILTLHDNTFTEAGYLDLGYNYPNYPNAGKYGFIRSHNPITEKGSGEASNKPDIFTFNQQLIAMLPEHEHDYDRGRFYTNAGGGGRGINDAFENATTKNTKSKDTSRYTIGKHLYPSSFVTRFLIKI